MRIVIILFQYRLEQPWIANEAEQLEPVQSLQIGNMLKYQIFCDLWHKGFYITDGNKFGGDFLAYPGDPIMFHAKYIVICSDETEIEGISETELVAKSRLATSVKKTVLLAFMKADKIKYKSVKWTERE